MTAQLISQAASVIQSTKTQSWGGEAERNFKDLAPSSDSPYKGGKQVASIQNTDGCFFAETMILHG
jgi:hypothetical protein